MRSAVCFVVTKFPSSMFFMVFGMTGYNIVQYTNLRYVVQFIEYLNVCSNPLAYALKYRRVQASVRRMLAALQGHRPQQNTSQAGSGSNTGTTGVLPNSI